MNRTAEFFKFVDKSIQKNPKMQTEKFYETLNLKIAKLREDLENSCSYKSILVIEDKIAKLQQEILLLDKIEVKEMGEIFEGIKYILKQRINDLIKLVKKKKRIDSVELQEERPKTFKQVRGEVSKQMQMENKRIVNGQEYEQTRMRLMKIEAVQKAINEHLCIQDERIDDICDTASQSNKIYDNINEICFEGAGSFFRRLLFVILICLTFVIVFLHLYYRKY